MRIDPGNTLIIGFVLIAAGCTADSVVNPEIDPSETEAIEARMVPGVAEEALSVAAVSGTGACEDEEAPAVGTNSGELLIRVCDKVDPNTSILISEEVRVMSLVNGSMFHASSLTSSCTGESKINWIAGLDRTIGCNTSNQVHEGRTYLIYMTDAGSDRFIARWPSSPPANPDIGAQWAGGEFTDVNAPAPNWIIDDSSVPEPQDFKFREGEFGVQLLPGGGSNLILTTSSTTYILDFSPLLSLVDGHFASGELIQVGGTISGNTIKVYDWREIFALR